MDPLNEQFKTYELVFIVIHSVFVCVTIWQIKLETDSIIKIHKIVHRGCCLAISVQLLRAIDLWNQRGNLGFAVVDSLSVLVTQILVVIGIQIMKGTINLTYRASLKHMPVGLTKLFDRFGIAATVCVILASAVSGIVQTPVSRAIGQIIIALESLGIIIIGNYGGWVATRIIETSIEATETQATSVATKTASKFKSTRLVKMNKQIKGYRMAKRRLLTVLTFGSIICLLAIILNVSGSASTIGKGLYPPEKYTRKGWSASGTVLTWAQTCSWLFIYFPYSYLPMCGGKSKKTKSALELHTGKSSQKSHASLQEDTVNEANGEADDVHITV